MNHRFSISLRLTFWFSAVFLAGFLIFGAALYFDLAYSLGAGRDKTLLNRARRLQELLESTRAESEARRFAKFFDFTEATPEGNLIQVFDSQGTRVYPPAGLQAVRFPWPAVVDSGRRFSKRWYDGRQYRVLAEMLSIGNGKYRLLIAGQLEDNRLMLNRFAGTLLWATPALIIMSALCGYFLSRRVLNPIARLTASARSISIGNLQRRLPISNTGDELQKLAETCNDMLSRLEIAVNQITRFTADASHELRSPITYIRTVSELALRSPHTDAESADSFQEIVRESEEATRLLEDMLTLARADAGQAGLEFGPVNLDQIFQDTYRRAKPVADGKLHGISMSSNAKGTAEVTGNEASLRRLFWILVDNAIRYTPSGGRIHLELRVEHLEACFMVQDNGVGIPESALAHIFDRFYRVDGDRNREEGTGLGLAIAKWIADVHRIQLSAKSAPGDGSKFSAVLRINA